MREVKSKQLSMIESNTAYTDCIFSFDENTVFPDLNNVSFSGCKFKSHLHFINPVQVALDKAPAGINILVEVTAKDSLSQLLDCNLKGYVTSFWTRFQLAKLPSKISQLSNLRDLSLFGRDWEGDSSSDLDLLFHGHTIKLKCLPPEIGKLVNLKEIHLGETQLAHLPAEIGELVSLETLYLDSCQLTLLPVEIGKLVNLKRIHIGKSQLISLPPQIGQLTNLTIIYMYESKLTHLPTEFGLLTSLEQLHLTGSKLTSLPPEFEKLSKLKQLYLEIGAQELPPAITQLVNLQELHLVISWVEELPVAFWKLANLHTLSFQSVLLQQLNLPSENAQITKLQSLDLSGLALDAIPAEIGLLTSLTILKLGAGISFKNLPLAVKQLAKNGCKITK